MIDNPIVVALDLPVDRALRIASALRERVRWMKVGMTLYYAEGPQIVSRLRDMGFDVFVDLKLHDIPYQVFGAAAQIARLGVGMFTVHASGGAAMMAAAVDAARTAAADAGMPSPAVLAVTVLTSTDNAGLRDVGIARTAEEQVALLAGLAREAGVDGLVCSPHEAVIVSKLLGPEALIVTPGVRPAGAAVGDQSRIATPAAAIAAGATHLVIGRPITAAPRPVEAVDLILAELEGALS